MDQVYKNKFEEFTSINGYIESTWEHMPAHEHWLNVISTQRNKDLGGNVAKEVI